MPDADPAPPLPLFTARSWAVAGDPSGTASPAPKPEVTEGLELFQAACETATDGYSAWKTAMTAEKAAAETRRRGTELPVYSDAGGFARWKQESGEARRAFEKRWGIPPGKRVRLRLCGDPREHEGILRLVGEALRQLRAAAPPGPGRSHLSRLADREPRARVSAADGGRRQRRKMAGISLRRRRASGQTF